MSNIDKNTEAVILPENIVHTTDTDYIVAEKDSWRLVPKISVVNDKTITLEDDTPTNTDVSTISNDLPDSTEKVMFSFGVNHLKASYKSFHDVSGILTNPIDTTNCRYVELDAKINETPNSSIEFSIYDGNTEYPILPKSITTIQDELMFSGLPTRFSIDTSSPITIKKNGDVFGVSYLDFDKDLLKTSDRYTISYTPVNPYRLAITNTSIRLKVVVRVYNEGYPPSIRNITIMKSGGILQWQI